MKTIEKGSGESLMVTDGDQGGCGIEYVARSRVNHEGLHGNSMGPWPGAIFLPWQQIS